MPLPTPRPIAPTTAERIRSACVRSTGAVVAIDGAEPVATAVHHLLADGSFAVTLPRSADAALGDVPPTGADAPGPAAVLELTDHAPLPLREPVRSLVWIRGRLQRVPFAEVGALLDRIAEHDANPALLAVDTGRGGGGDVLVRLAADSVVVADSTGAESVTVASLLAADPDPFCDYESGWLQHIDSDHHDVIVRLAGRLPAGLRRGTVRPLGIDRYGVRLRIEDLDGDHDVRLPFDHPVDDLTGLSRALRVLMGCPYLNGLRARRI